jgi:hypothetical protein
MSSWLSGVENRRRLEVELLHIGELLGNPRNWR